MDGVTRYRGRAPRPDGFGWSVASGVALVALLGAIAYPLAVALVAAAVVAGVVAAIRNG